MKFTKILDLDKFPWFLERRSEILSEIEEVLLQYQSLHKQAPEKLEIFLGIVCFEHLKNVISSKNILHLYGLEIPVYAAWSYEPTEIRMVSQ